MAALQIAEIGAAWGRRAEAVAPTEEAVSYYEALAEENRLPTRPGMALNNLGNSYGEIGRRGRRWLRPKKLSATTRHWLKENPAYLPDLAVA